MPKISIIIPTYNSAKTIAKTLKSIFNQTYRDFELIIVNDGSTDNTAEILKKFQQKFQISNFKFQIIDQNNQGSNQARNRGAREAGGEYLLFCDSDIIMEPEMLEKMIRLLEVDQDKSYVYSSFKFGWKKFKLWPFNPERLRQMPFIHTTSLIRRKHFPGFDPKIKRFQDWDLWLTMLEQGHEGIYLPEFLFKVKPRKKGISFWLPKIFYKIPWEKLGIKIKAVEKYKEAMKVIKEKHHLT